MAITVFGLAISTSFAQDFSSLLKAELITTRSADGLELLDVEGLSIYNQSTSKNNTITHVYAVQKHNGIEIFNGNVAAAFRGQDIIHIGDNLQRGISSRIIGTSPVLNPVQAATSAAQELGVGSANFTVIESLSNNEALLNTGGVSVDNVPVKLVYQAVDDNSLRLAWDLSIHTTDGANWWSVRVDAVTGDIISQHNWIVTCTFESHDHNQSNVSKKTHKAEAAFGFASQDVNAPLAGEQYNVFPVPFESPNHGPNSLVTDPQDLEASPFGWHDTNGVEGPEFTTTIGNNVLASDDIANNNAPGFSPDGGEDLIFDFPYNFETAPVNMLSAVTTNLFYWNNVLHDVLYHYGFDERSGNFQETNYSGEGVGDDSVIANSQDGGGLNNATFGTPPEGFRPTMSMFLWSAQGPPGESLTINGGSLDGSYIGVPAAFGAPLPEDEPLTGTLALVEDDNAGASTDATDACDTIINGASLAGNIVVIRRGECEFGVKILAAENEGATAVIMVNNVGTAPISMGPGAVGDQVTIPSIMVTQADGEAIIAALEAGETIDVSILNAGPFQIDGSLDNGVIAHEYGHGVSNRLTAGPAAVNCIFNDEGMGEGWSDYIGLMLTMDADDTAEQGRGIGTFVTGQPVTGGGIRPAPYSVDFAVNALTYDDTNNTQAISVPHGIGTVWATILWDMTWMFIDEYGFDEDLYNGTGGNNIALQIVMDGLKLQPCNPGFVTGRDALLAAVEINEMIPDEDKSDIRCAMWGVFANRGLGVGAEQGSAFSRVDQIENFDTPSQTDPDSDCFDALSVDNITSSIFSIFPNPTNGDITINTAASLGEGQVSIFDLNGREVYKANVSLNGAVQIDARSLSQGVYLIQIVTDNVTETSKLIIR